LIKIQDMLRLKQLAHHTCRPNETQCAPQTAHN
jgi:hypothetical protein